MICDFYFSGARLEALNTLKLFIDIVNEIIGDAFSDFLAVETILHEKGWSLGDWEMLYDVLPYQMLKVTIKVSCGIFSKTDFLSLGETISPKGGKSVMEFLFIARIFRILTHMIQLMRSNCFSVSERKVTP